jgi:hypothetical protein
MTFAFSDEQQELRRGLRRFLADKSPPSEVRRLMDTDAGYDPGVWAQMAAQLGLQGLTIPPEYGGAGYGPIELAIVLEEMGRALLCAPYLSTAVLAVAALQASGDAAAQREWFPGMAAGTTIATLAVCEDDGAWSTDRLQTRAQQVGGGYVIHGRKSFVLDGAIADRVLVVAQADGGPTLFAVDGGDPRLVRRPLQTIDMTRKQALLVFDSVPARRVGRAGAAAPIVARTVALASIALAAEQVGGAQRCLEMSVDYAKLRVQLGVRSAAFRRSNTSARTCCSRSRWRSPPPITRPGLPSRRRTTCHWSPASPRRSARRRTFAPRREHPDRRHRFTWEQTHLYFRRAKASEVMLGSPHHRELMAAHLIDGAPADVIAEEAHEPEIAATSSRRRTTWPAKRRLPPRSCAPCTRVSTDRS